MQKARNILNATAMCLAALFSAALIAQSRQSVAIMQPFGNAAVTNMNKFNVRSALTEVLVATGRYDALDRNRIDQVMQERGFQRSAFSDSSKAKELGKMLGADMICVTELMKEGNEFMVEAQIINVETGRIAHTASEHLENESNAAIRKAVQALVDRMLKTGDGSSAPASGIAAQILADEKRNLQFGPFRWRVLDVHSDKALLITENVIETRAYHNTYTAVTWATCDLRSYLNGYFLQQKFTPEQQRQILETTIRNPNNPQYRTSGGPSTTDRIFLLSIDEARLYFSSDSDRKTGNDWWLRSPGDRSHFAAYSFGQLNVRGIQVTGDHVSVGVRPALWIKLQ